MAISSKFIHLCWQKKHNISPVFWTKEITQGTEKAQVSKTSRKFRAVYFLREKKRPTWYGEREKAQPRGPAWHPPSCHQQINWSPTRQLQTSTQFPIYSPIIPQIFLLRQCTFKLHYSHHFYTNFRPIIPLSQLQNTEHEPIQSSKHTCPVS